MRSRSVLLGVFCLVNDEDLQRHVGETAPQPGGRAVELVGVEENRETNREEELPSVVREATESDVHINDGETDEETTFFQRFFDKVGVESSQQPSQSDSRFLTLVGA